MGSAGRSQQIGLYSCDITSHLETTKQWDTRMRLDEITEADNTAEFFELLKGRFRQHSPSDLGLDVPLGRLYSQWRTGRAA